MTELSFFAYYLKSAKEYFYPRITQIWTNWKYFLLKTHEKPYFTTIGTKIPLPTFSLILMICFSQRFFLAKFAKKSQSSQRFLWCWFSLIFMICFCKVFFTQRTQRSRKVRKDFYDADFRWFLWFVSAKVFSRKVCKEVAKFVKIF